MKEDTTTEGNWIGAYGSQGYDIVSGPTSLPSYAALTTTGATNYTWTTTSTSQSALQVPGSSNRVAACWYSWTSFSINLDLTDGQTHDIALYACAYDDEARSEQIQITNATTGTVLDTETLSNFISGVYMQWAVSGNVVITITKLTGPNALVNGFFLDPLPTAATFVKADTTTEGNWIDAYGSQGYDIVSGPTSLPSYAALTTTSATNYTWTTTSTSQSALQVPGSSNRVAACWYSWTSFSINLDLTNGQTHDIALYACAYDDEARSEQIQITNATTGTVLDTETLSNFISGVYMQWAVSGDVVITITKLTGPNALVNALFVDPATSTAKFVKADTTTEGNWIGAYGSQGYDIVSGPTSLPSYAALTTIGATNYTWTTTSTSQSALQVPGSSNRVAACWYSWTSFSINLDLTNGQTHNIALYACAYDDEARSEQIQITNAATGAVLDTETLSNFISGVYLQWKVSGNVVITVTKLTGPNALINAVFFDPVTTTATFEQKDTTTEGNWIGAYGSQGYDIVSGPTSLPSYAALTTTGATNYTWTTTSTSQSCASKFRAVPTGLRLAGIRGPAFRSTWISPMARRTTSLCMPVPMTTRHARNRFRSRMQQPERSSTPKPSPISSAGSTCSGRSREMW